MQTPPLQESIEPNPAALAPGELKRRCAPEQLGFRTTDEVPASEGFIAQDRAVAALELATQIRSWSHNVYVMGRPGSGRHAAVRLQLEHCAATRDRPSDWCYVNRFDDPRRPRALRLPCGRAAQLQDDVRELMEGLRTAVPAALESDAYRARLAEIDSEIERLRESSLESLRREAEKSQMGLIQTPHGFAIVPLRDGKLMSPDEFERMPEDERRRVQERSQALSEMLRRHVEALPMWLRDRARKLRELDRQVTADTVRQLIHEIRAKYSDCPDVLDHLARVEADLAENARNLFREEPESPFAPGVEKAERQMRLDRYDVNVIVDGRALEGAPVIYESNPTYQNLIGAMESVAHFGLLSTDFTMIRGGALHAANGGFLILDAERLLTQPFAWEALKHALFERRVRIEPLGQRLSLISTHTLEPEPVPLEVRVVLIGTRPLYGLLCEYDPEFAELFKIAADFEDTIDRKDETIPLYAQLIAGAVRRAKLRAFDASAISRLVEHGSRLAGDSRKLSIHLRSMDDVLREADHFASAAGREVVRDIDVQHALDERVRRLGRLHAKTLEAIRERSLLIDSDGEAVGQVNGVSVVQVGPLLFGHPVRITASARIGEGELLDIEREVRLGGAIHSKGVLILSALIGARFGRTQPLSLHASLVFEQSYSAVEGDSASLAEACALLSAIAQIPLRQSLAVTGSISQHGIVQVVGAVNEKIEGFFDACQVRGLTGRQGVIIPADNVAHLMLRDDVIHAVERGSFHVYAVRTLDEAIPLLTGVEAGVRDPQQGAYPPGTLHARVEERLQEFAQARQRFAREALATRQISKEPAGPERDR